MRRSGRRPAAAWVAAITVSAVLLSGCSSSSTASSRSSRVTQSPQVTSGPFSKGQRIGPDALVRITRAAVEKAGATIRSTTTTPEGTFSSQIRYVYDRTEASSKGRLAGKNISIVVIAGVTYIGGLGMGPKPYLEVTPQSSGAFAQGLKPLLNIAGGGALPKSAIWTVASVSRNRMVFEVAPNPGTSVTTTLDGKYLPVSTVTVVSGKTMTVKYTDVGAPVDISAPPASQVADISTVTPG